MQAPRLLTLLGLLAALLLPSCGDNPEALNAQGYRAMRFDAFEDAYWFFHYSEEMLENGGEEYPAEHPEHLRLRVGQLALELREHPERSDRRLGEELAALEGIESGEAGFFADQLRKAERSDLADRFLAWSDHSDLLENVPDWLGSFDADSWAASLGLASAGEPQPE